MNNDIFKSADAELTNLSVAFSTANEALGRLTYILGNLKSLYKNCDNVRQRGTGDIPHKPEVQSVKIGIHDETEPAKEPKPEPKAVKDMDLKEIVGKILELSRFDVPRKCLLFRTPEDGVIEFLVQKSSSGFYTSEGFSVILYDNLKYTAALFDEGIDSLYSFRFPHKEESKKDDEGGWDSLA